MPRNKEVDQFYTFNPKNCLPLGGGPWNLQFVVFLPHRYYISNLVKILPTVLEKIMLPDDARRTSEDGRKPIATGHLSDSGDLKICIYQYIVKILEI